jgi:hypothetical protein
LFVSLSDINFEAFYIIFFIPYFLVPEECSEFSKYFEIVKENPKDWDTWVYLLTLVEQQVLH